MKRKSAAAAAGGILTVILFAFGKEFSLGALSGLKICAEILIPSLFPFMVAAALTSAGELPPFIKSILTPVTRFLFRLPADGAFAITLGLLGGYPTGAKTAVSLYRSGKISREQAQRLMLYCVNAGAGFCVNAVGSGMLNSRKSGYILLVSLCISALILGFFTRGKNEKSISAQQILPLPFSKALVGSVSSSATGMLLICAFVTLFSGVIAAFSSIGISEKFLLPFCCILEVTSGCAEAAGKVSLPVIAAVCAFGGICVHMQIFALAEDLLPPVGKFYLYRLFHALLSGGICFILLKIFPVELQTVSVMQQNAALVSFSVPAAVSLLFLSALLILDLDSGKKMC